MKKVNIIIVNYNCWEDTKEAVRSVLNSTYQDFIIHIVDNSSTDDSLKNLHLWFRDNNIDYSFYNTKNGKSTELDISKVVLIEHSKNNGFASGNNVIIEYLLKHKINEYVWLLNPDTIIEKETMKDLVSMIENKQKVILGNIICYEKNPDEILFCGGFKVKKYTHGISRIVNPDNIKDLEVITGASLFTRVLTFQELGLLNEDYFMYWEETDFCTNATRRGYSFDVNLKSKILDKVGSTSNTNFLREYLYILNGLRYYKKYYPSKIVTIYLSTLLKLIKAIVTINKVKVKAIIYAHIDFIIYLIKGKIDVKKRIK